MINNILKSLSILSLFLVLGCDPVDGNLTVTKKFTVKKMTDPQCLNDAFSCMNQDENQQVETGSYDMKLDIDSKKSLFLQISKKWTLIKLELNMPENKSVPSTGELKLSASDSGQPFDFTIKSQTDITNSSMQNGSESCSERVQTEVCYIVPGNPPTKKCEIKWVTAKGLQYVEYYYRNTYQQVESLFLAENTEEVLAVYKGSRSDSDKIYTRRDRCELHRPYVYDN